MSTNVKLAVVLLVVAFNLTAASPSLGQYFLDDFEDGSATDGMPVSWIPVPGWDGGTRVVDAGDYTLTPDGPGPAQEMDSDVEGLIFADVSLRTQLRCGARALAFVSARSSYGNANFDTNYQVWGFIRSPNGLIGIGYSNGIQGHVLEQVDTSLNAASQDVHLQLDVFGDLLTLTAWADGDPQPPVPQLSADISATTDLQGNTHDDGTIGLFTYTDGGTMAATCRFRYFEAAPIPEPSSLMSLGMAIGMALVSSRRRR